VEGMESPAWNAGWRRSQRQTIEGVFRVALGVRYLCSVKNLAQSAKAVIGVGTRAQPSPQCRQKHR
jgi:hypothetical protein